MTAAYTVLAFILLGPIIALVVFIADKRAKRGLKKSKFYSC